MRGYRHAIDEFVDWYCSEPRVRQDMSCAAALISNFANSHQAPSIFVLVQGVGAHMKRPTAVASAPIWLPAFAALKE